MFRRTAFTNRAGAAFLLLAAGAVMTSSAAQSDKAAPKSIGQVAGAATPPANSTGREDPKDVAAVPTDPDGYQIGAGDVLQVSVWKEPDALVPSVTVRPDGMITVPLLKDIQVTGRTPRQVEKLIVDGLGQYINSPNVTVVVAATGSKKVYLIGAVKKEGPIAYSYRMTVLQALSEAGGLTDYAKRKKLYVVRTESGRDYRLDFNYDEVIKGERMEQNIMLLPGDTLVIPH